jgi:Secretion system C-terminal sorting domain
MMMKKLYICLLFMSAVINSYGQSNNPINQTVSEDDWSLPSYVAKNYNSGLYYAYTVPDAYSLLVRWKDLNPAENVYDWSIIDNAVALNVPFFIRIWSSDTMHCPQWVKAKHPTIPILHNEGGTGTSSYYDLFGTSPSNFFAPWDSAFSSEFKIFLLAFKAKNYLANPNVKFMYAPGFWRYNEFNLGEAVQAIETSGLITIPNFIIWYQSHLDDYVDASNGYPYKMMYTGYGKIENPANYGPYLNWFLATNDTTNGNNLLTSYAVSIGMSVREGAQEYFNSSSDMYAWGAPSITENNINYQTVLDSHPLHSDILRNIGTENEVFCEGALGTGLCNYYHIKMSTLKAMQLRVNWLNVTDTMITYNPNLFQYFRLTANKSAETSPDAWVCLRQTYDPLFSNIPPTPVLNSNQWIHRVTLPYRNWEKWLTQREVLTNGNTVPVYQLNTSNTFDYYNFKAFEALRTDKDNGSNYMYFNLDSNYIFGGSNDIQLKITYLDNFSGNWWVEYDAAGSQIFKQSSQITNINNNIWKTVTINIPDAGFTNRQNGGMDFRIYNGGTNDITVRFVRVIKNINPILSTNNYEFEMPTISLFPNPTNNMLSIETDQLFNKIIITNLVGQKIFEKSYNFETQGTQIDLSDLENGVYLVYIYIGDKYYTNKILKN